MLPRPRQEHLFCGQPGYGVMPKHFKWGPRIKGAAAWLLDPSQTPTNNPLILSERKRLNPKTRRRVSQISLRDKSRSEPEGYC